MCVFAVLYEITFSLSLRSMLPRIRSIRITERLVLNFILIGLGSVIIISFLSYRQLKKAILERTFQQLTAVRIISQSQVEAFFSNRLSDVKLLADNQNALLAGNNDFSGFPLSFLKKYGFYQGVIISTFGQVKSVNFEDTEISGNGVANYVPYLDSLLSVPNGKPGGAMILDFYRKGSGETPVLFAVAPFSTGKKTTGYVALPVSSEAVNSLMIELEQKGGFGESGEAYLVGEDFKMRSNSRFEKVSVLKTEVKTEASTLAFSEGAGTKIVTDYRGIEVLSSFCRLRINGLNWVLLSEIDFKEVMAPIIVIRNQILVFSLLISFFIFLLALFISRRITKPIIALKKATSALAMGEFPHVQPEGIHDEIDELLDSFNDMSASLKEKQELLDTERKRNLSAMIDGQEQERKRLSLDLHDGLGQSLVAIKYNLEAVKDTNPEYLSEVLQKTKLEISEAISETRNMSNNLMPTALGQFGFINAMQQLCLQIHRDDRIIIEFDAEGDFKNLSDRKQIYIYRIVQEALSNALKHSGASRINIQIMVIKTDILLMIEDDGTGFDIEQKVHCGGRGITGMRERVNLLNGVFEIRQGLGKGTIIQIRIPLL